MPKIVLYGMDLSPSVRACLLTLHALDIPFEYKIVDLFHGENLTPEFKQKNPQHTVPVLDDDGTCIFDSHAINAYLVDKYGKTDALYPKDLTKRAIVEQRMYFDASVLYSSLFFIVLPMYKHNETTISKEKIGYVKDAYTHLENFLENKSYLTGENLTIADFSCIGNVTSLRGLVPIKKEEYPRTFAWLERISKLPYYEKANGKGVAEYIAFLKTRFTKIELE